MTEGFFYPKKIFLEELEVQIPHRTNNNN